MKASFAQTKNRYESIKRETEAVVARWRYQAWETWHWDPHVLHTLKRFPDSPLPSPTGAKWAYGFDRKDSLVVMKEINTDKPIEVFMRDNGPQFSGAKFCAGKLQEVFDVTTEDGLTVKVESENEALSMTNSYTWRNGKPATKRTDFHDGDVSESVLNEDWNVLEEWKIKPDGSRVPANPVLPKGTNLKSLTVKLTKQLPVAIKAQLAKSKIRGPVYCLALAYDGENPGLSLACVGIGLESECKKFLTKPAEKLPNFLWNPAEFHFYDKPPVHLTGEELE